MQTESVRPKRGGRPTEPAIGAPDDAKDSFPLVEAVSLLPTGAALAWSDVCTTSTSTSTSRSGRIPAFVASSVEGAIKQNHSDLILSFQRLNIIHQYFRDVCPAIMCMCPTVQAAGPSTQQSHAGNKNTTTRFSTRDTCLPFHVCARKFVLVQRILEMPSDPASSEHLPEAEIS